MKQKVIIVGGGASGLTAAIWAARQGACVTILEHTARPGKKLLSTGNGKCNLTNLKLSVKDYRGGSPDFIQTVLKNADVQKTLDFFSGLGLMLTDRNGYVYPASGQASSVLDGLRFELEHLGVKVLCDCQVNAIGKDLSLATSLGKQKADAVILSTGSKAAPKTGSDGSGYQLAKALGHRIITPLPALVQLKCGERWHKEAAGVRAEALITLQSGNKPLSKDRGEIQFTDYGLSGIPVFQVSRFAAKALEQGKEVSAVLDLMPDHKSGAIKSLLEQRARNFSYRPAGEYLNGVFNKKLGSILLKEAGIGKGTVGEISPAAIEKLTAAIKGLKAKVTAVNSFDQAQVCSGGVDLREVNPDTMESRLIPNLYFAGEILDVDGICGGYNLQWAWSSGIIAGINAAKGKDQRNHD